MSNLFCKSGLVAVGVLTVGAMLSGCSPDVAPVPLTLYIEPVIAQLDEDIIVALENPSRSKLFIPTAWTGMAIYRKSPGKLG